MNIEVMQQDGIRVAMVYGDGLLLSDVQSTLDLIANVHYQTGCDRIAIPKQNIVEDFFVLSTKVAGEMLQKFINYKAKLAIIGDFSGYTSKALRDFIYESNNGKDIFFVATQQEALDKLAGIR